MTIDMTTCPTPHKFKFSDRAHAKRAMKKRRITDANVYLCQCGAIHIGHWGEIKDRQAHREWHGAEPTPEDEPLTVSLRMAAEELAVRADFLEGLITDGKMHAHVGRNGTWRVPVKEIEKWKTLMMRSA